MDRRHHPLFPRSVTRNALAAAALALLLSACGGSEGASPEEPLDRTTSTSSANDSAEFFPDVVEATATQDADGTWTFAVTLSSPYDTPEQYADAWRVVDGDGSELGLRFLTHDHASEQPFTRSHSGIVIPDGITTVTIQGRDQVNGWGGAFLEFELPV